MQTEAKESMLLPKAGPTHPVQDWLEDVLHF